MGIFERFLTVWVGLCILGGVLLGNLVPSVFQWVAKLEVAHVNIPVAIFIWVMIYPMMVQVDFSSIKHVGRKPTGLLLTLSVNWLIKPSLAVRLSPSHQKTPDELPVRYPPILTGRTAPSAR